MRAGDVVRWTSVFPRDDEAHVVPAHSTMAVNALIAASDGGLNTCYRSAPHANRRRPGASVSRGTGSRSRRPVPSMPAPALPDTAVVVVMVAAATAAAARWTSSHEVWCMSKLQRDQRGCRGGRCGRGALTDQGRVSAAQEDTVIRSYVRIYAALTHKIV